MKSSEEHGFSERSVAGHSSSDLGDDLSGSRYRGRRHEGDFRRL